MCELLCISSCSLSKSLMVEITTRTAVSGIMHQKVSGSGNRDRCCKFRTEFWQVHISKKETMGPQISILPPNFPTMGVLVLKFALLDNSFQTKTTFSDNFLTSKNLGRRVNCHWIGLSHSVAKHRSLMTQVNCVKSAPHFHHHHHHHHHWQLLFKLQSVHFFFPPFDFLPPLLLAPPPELDWVWEEAPPPWPLRDFSLGIISHR